MDRKDDAIKSLRVVFLFCSLCWCTRSCVYFCSEIQSQTLVRAAYGRIHFWHEQFDGDITHRLNVATSGLGSQTGFFRPTVVMGLNGMNLY